MKTSSLKFLLLGDALAVALVTLIGFATHKETGVEFLPRMAATFAPVLVSWALAAYSLGLFDATVAANPRQLWRVLAALVFAGPLAALLRALWLNSVVIPVFALVLTGVSALGMLLWRGLWCWLAARLRL